MQYGLSVTYPAWNSTNLETTDVNRCAGGDWHEMFLHFQQAVWQAQQMQFWGLGRVFDFLYGAYNSNTRISGTGVIFWASQHLKDVPFVREV